jgi:uncharacterized protein
VKTALLDINVLIALAWPSHVHHACAQRWFTQHAREGWATCPLTQLGFVRISSNPAIIPEAVSPAAALTALAAIVAHRHHVFWPDSLSLGAGALPVALIAGHRQLTDAYLLGLALHHRGKLVTLDRALPDLLPAADPRRAVVELIDVGPARKSV